MTKPTPTRETIDKLRCTMCGAPDVPLTHLPQLHMSVCADCYGTTEYYRLVNSMKDKV